MPVLAAALKERETRRAHIRHELAALDAPTAARFDPRRVERELRKRLTEWRDLLGRHTPIARQIVTKLLDGRIVWTPKPEAGCYEFHGRTVLDRLLTGLITPDFGVPCPS